MGVNFSEEPEQLNVTPAPTLVGYEAEERDGGHTLKDRLYLGSPRHGGRLSLFGARLPAAAWCLGSLRAETRPRPPGVTLSPDAPSASARLLTVAATMSPWAETGCHSTAPPAEALPSSLECDYGSPGGTEATAVL